MSHSHTLHLDLDGAWPEEVPGVAARLDCRALGPHLRYSATSEAMSAFASHLAPHPFQFALLGSGDFHHLSSVLIRRVQEPFTLVSFDNHPDWDIRPPRWCCGTWMNRALEHPQLERIGIWGCGNYELHWPSSLFANHRALRAGRLEVWPWEERLSPAARRKWRAIDASTWRAEFERFAEKLAGKRLYITIDMDCLREEDAATNWESGLFHAEDVAWAIRILARSGTIVAGDVCGAYSEPVYARFKQRIEARLDHPQIPPLPPAAARARNLQTLPKIWPALVGAPSIAA